MPHHCNKSPRWRTRKKFAQVLARSYFPWNVLCCFPCDTINFANDYKSYHSFQAIQVMLWGLHKKYQFLIIIENVLLSDIMIYDVEKLFFQNIIHHIRVSFEFYLSKQRKNINAWRGSLPHGNRTRWGVFLDVLISTFLDCLARTLIIFICCKLGMRFC